MKTSDGYNNVTVSYTITIIYNEKLVFVPKPGTKLSILEEETYYIRAVDPTGLPVKVEFDVTGFSPIMPRCAFLRGNSIIIKPNQLTNLTFNIAARADNGKMNISGSY